MGRTRGFDETEILDSAIEAFLERGYEATSVEDLTESTGLARSSLYAAFGSKEELFNTALARYIEKRVGAQVAELERGSDGAPAIRGFFENVASAAAGGGTMLGCLAANTIAELGVRGAAQRPLLDGYRARLGRAFEAALDRAVAAGEVDARDRSLRARSLSTLALGLFLLVRGNDHGAAESGEVVQTVDMLLQSWRPSSSSLSGG
jgi:TetR/AcrR family transcriptional repressor of nem operon